MTSTYIRNFVERERFAETANNIAITSRLIFMYATDDRILNGVYTINAVFESPDKFETLYCVVPQDDLSYPSLTVSIMAAHWFERLIGDQFGIVATGHPDWRRLVNHENMPDGTHYLRKDFAWNTKLPIANEEYPMHKVQGVGMYEIPVGPIHAGIIEPGHFRFSVQGERIALLEGKLFFKHKGVEKLMEDKTPQEAIAFVERVSGDMVAGHTLAYCQAVESAVGSSVPDRAKYLRVVWSELERVTAHIFDIGNIAGMGTGFSFMAAQGFRIVEELRRMNKEIVGHRFLRGAILLGGAHDIDAKAERKILTYLAKAEKELHAMLQVAFAQDGLMERFETTGVLGNDAAVAYGARGVAARASGIDSDMRRDHAYAAYDKIPFHIHVKFAGDVRARFSLRILEINESISLIRNALSKMPKGAVICDMHAREGEALGHAESFRGAIVDFVRIRQDGKIDRCAISDPSFCNWPLFGEIGPGNIVPDFPLCNKSLNLSYSGNDL